MAAYAEITTITYKERGVNGRTHPGHPNQEPRLAQVVRTKKFPVVIGGGDLPLRADPRGPGKLERRISDPSTLTGIKAIGYHFIGALSIFLVPAAWVGSVPVSS